MSNTEWKKVKLGDIIVKMGKTEHPAKDALDSGKYPFFTNSASKKKFYIDDFDFDEPIILANTGGKAYFKYCDVKCSASRDLYIFKTVPDVDVKYLYYVLKDMEKDINDNGFAGAALKHLNKDYLHSREISLPSLEEQHRIASLLSRFDELIQLHEFKAENLIKAKQQIMSDIFSGGLRELESINPDDYVQDNWVTVKLGDILNFKYGKFNKNPDNGGEYPIYGANGVIGGYTEYNSEDAIVIGHIGQPGSVNFACGKHFVTYNGIITTVIDKNSTDTKMMYFMLSGLNLPSLAAGNAQKFISYDTLRSIEVKIPPTLEEQQKIANLLSSYDSLIEIKRFQKQQVTNMKQQLMSQLLTNGGGQSSWVTVKLGDIINLLDRLRKPISKGNRIAGEYPYYGANGIQDYVNDYIFNGRYILVGEDGSVITKDNTPVVNWGTGKFWANNHVHILEAKDGFDIDFIFYAISNADISGYVHGNIPKYTKGDLVDTQVKIPPTLEEQHHIASVLSTFDSLIEQIESEELNISSQKQAIMSKIFG